MALIGKSFGRGFGSTKKVSAYQQMQQWKAKQKAHSQKFLNQQAVASNVFAVGVSETQTATEMLFNNVAQRVKNEAKAKIAQQNGAIDQAIESLDSAKTGDKKTEGVDIKV
ncbi:hypothetical protein [Stappia sp. MMSF_3263]|jgi:hypothetical protein|uniref:hypothetical protein n=1 Tax=Stappia sp. MMSF_3263 TaxID=3046693 RepID=UPI00273E1867|nr:hypothetical protein [Stappia sp. MMSF_3263]